MSAVSEKPADAIQYHEDLAAQWEQRYQKKSFHVRIAVLKECLKGEPLQGSAWLDAGCGTGTLSRVLAELGCRVLGIDASAAMVAQARALSSAGAVSGAIKFDQVEDIAPLQFSDSSFDGILCSSVLEYLAAPEACLLDFARVLRPGGMLLVSVPNRRCLTRRLQVVCRSLGKYVGANWAEYLEISRNWYSVEEFRRSLAKCGFAAEKVVIFGGPFPRRIQQSESWGSLLMFVARKI